MAERGAQHDGEAWQIHVHQRQRLRLRVVPQRGWRAEAETKGANLARGAGLRLGLRRRHAEREHLLYAAARREAVRRRDGNGVPGPDGGGQKGWRRPFVTHFTGCQPCGGAPNRMYTRRRCAEGIRRALAFADDQVLRAYGFRHAAPLSDSVTPLPFDYPAAH